MQLTKGFFQDGVCVCVCVCEKIDGENGLVPQSYSA